MVHLRPIEAVRSVSSLTVCSPAGLSAAGVSVSATKDLSSMAGPAFGYSLMFLSACNLSGKVDEFG